MTAQEYLDSHGITEETVKRFELSFDADYIHIPVKDENGTTIFTKSRNLNFPNNDEPKYKNSQGSHATLFNLHMVKDAPSIVLCEGEIDTMRLIQEGIPSISSTGGASTFPEEWGAIFAGKTVWLCLDSDEAGQVGTSKILEYIPHAKVVALPVKDVCDFFQDHTKKDFLKLLKNAQTALEWEASHMPEDYKLVRDTELVAMEFPEESWLISNILYSEGFCFLYGAEGTGKSFIALSIAKAVATGTNWLDQFNVPEAQKVLVLDKENPLSMLKRRSEGLGSITDNIFYLMYPEKFSLADGKGGASEFAEALSLLVKKEDIKLIIIDSFVDLMVGNESSSGDTQVFFSALRTLFPQVAFLVLHHENKPSQGLFRNDSQRLRGSSNINAQTFTMFRLEQMQNAHTDLTLKQTKARDSVKLDKFMIRMLTDEDEKGKPIVTGFEYVGEIFEGAGGDKKEEAESLIKEAIAQTFGNEISKQDLIDQISSAGVSRRTIERVLSELAESGAVKKFKKTGKKEAFYELSEPIVTDGSDEGGLF